MSEISQIDSRLLQERPQHIAIIMDGNGRWARRRGLPRPAGHREGVKAVRGIVEACRNQGIGALTLFAFSSENWRRPRTEVRLLMDLFINTLKREVRDLHANNVQVSFIGDRSAFSDKLRRLMDESESLTADNDGLRLAIAVNYGGRWDIVEAARRLAAEARDGDLDPSEIDEENFSACLSLAQLPEPDLFIRTGGEQRISNFLLWQLAYTELYFTETLWPDFDAQCLSEALEWFAGRQRRFGHTGEQVERLKGA
ncbi:isoprenyl transferase [Thiohalobacter sp. IOR34]|uniref:isoprenyl transferase n=1 Tax=Thiohalobacter sp. IOR34 TaxID=3057176 RepID=UPI0025B0F104|nr:isoprenyl transferase [Thiohalobacter sp. IOR34]WJW76578.1 isoprenyl transferase [Thiohalobacter sp. IOR34]